MCKAIEIAVMYFFLLHISDIIVPAAFAQKNIYVHVWVVRRSLLIFYTNRAPNISPGLINITNPNSNANRRPDLKLMIATLTHYPFRQLFDEIKPAAIVAGANLGAPLSFSPQCTGEMVS